MEPIVFLPGIPGSQIVERFYETVQQRQIFGGGGGSQVLRERIIWGIPQAINGGFDRLRLDNSAAGVGRVIQEAVQLGAVNNTLGIYSTRFATNLHDLGWDVNLVGVDWRKNMEDEAVNIRDRIFGFLTTPFHLVAHSQGALAALWLWKLLADQNRADQIKSLVLVAPPLLGSWDILSVFTRENPLYLAMAAVEIAGRLWDARFLAAMPIGFAAYTAFTVPLAVRRLDGALDTMTGLLDLLPVPSGLDPDWRAAAAQLYVEAWWGGRQTQSALDNALARNTARADFLPPAADTLVLFSNGFTAKDAPASPTFARGVQYPSASGDGIVTTQSALWITCNSKWDTDGNHSSMLGSLRTAQQIDRFLRRATTPPAQVPEIERIQFISPLQLPTASSAPQYPPQCPPKIVVQP